MKKLTIALAQINPTTGDLKGNLKKIISQAKIAKKQRATMVVFPAMAITGYPLDDWLRGQELWRQTLETLHSIREKVQDIYVVVGLPVRRQKKTLHAAVVLYNGKIITVYAKRQLSDMSLLGERYYFSAEHTLAVFSIDGVKIALTMGDDIFIEEPQGFKESKVDILLSLNAEPFAIEQLRQREIKLRKYARRQRQTILHINMVGGQGELVFAGGSMVIAEDGSLRQRGAFFQEELLTVNLEALKFRVSKLLPLPTMPSAVSLIYGALVLGVRDYFHKNNFKRALVSVSGGIDSALVLAIAVDALGKENVETCYLPSRYSSKLSNDIVRKQAKLLGVTNTTISIEPIFKKYLATFEDKRLSVTIRANLQARCRATMVMTMANSDNALVIATSNKSEMAVGYTTLYGDMAGGFAPLCDVTKTLVYELAHHRNDISHAIPEAAIGRAPTAELVTDQRDSDDLPPYVKLDEIIKRYVELQQSRETIIKAGFSRTMVDKVLKMIARSEYKRRQSPSGPRITSAAFGSDRRYSLASGFRF